VIAAVPEKVIEMPIHVTVPNRRDFLVAGCASLASLACSQSGSAAPSDRSNLIALLSDTHIPQSPDISARGVNMTDNLHHVVSQLCQLPVAPSGVVINGDCAYLKGLPQDYANLAACVEPLATAGLPLHLTMGNHDDRGPLYNALANQRPDHPPVQSKHVSVIELPHANIFLLDSLFEVDVVTGELGQEQLTWLAKELDARPDKPAIVMSHHNPQFTAPAAERAWTGIKDTDDFFTVLQARPQVKAYFFGHTHHWSITQREGIHLINLPPVAYVFSPSDPNGWVMANLLPQGIELELHTIDPADPRNGQKVAIDWR